VGNSRASTAFGLRQTPWSPVRGADADCRAIFQVPRLHVQEPVSLTSTTFFLSFFLLSSQGVVLLTFFFRPTRHIQFGTLRHCIYIYINSAQFRSINTSICLDVALCRHFTCSVLRTHHFVLLNPESSTSSVLPLHNLFLLQQDT
jgi:hypothetical protein